jgi:hypothetical protein
LRDQVEHRVSLADVARDPETANTCGHLLRALLINVGHDHTSPACRQGFGQSPSNSVAATGHNGTARVYV